MIWQVLTVVAMKIAVLVDLAPCSLVITSILEETAASTFKVQKCRRRCKDGRLLPNCDVYHNTLHLITVERKANLHQGDNS